MTVFVLISFSKGIYDDHDYIAYTFGCLEVVISWITVALMLKTKSLRLRRLEELNSPLNRSSDNVVMHQTELGVINIVLEYNINKRNDIKFKLTAGKVHKKVRFRSLIQF